jgi:hypothetical protein
MILDKYRKMGERCFLSIVVFLLAIYWLLFHFPCLNYYWNSDDLHLIRQFSKTEIIQVFSSTWDVDNIETPGFRPFTLLFNHFRYILIGESPAFHRLFLLVLMTALLWMIGWIFIKYGFRRRIVAFALLILVSTKSLTGDIVWIADGIHIFQNCLIVVSIILMILFIDSQSLWDGFFSLGFAWVALCTREDSFVLLLLMPFLFIVYYSQVKGFSNLKEIFHTKRRKFLVYFVFLFSISGITLLYRSLVIPGVPDVSSIMGMLNQVRCSVWIVGGIVARIMPVEWESIQEGGYLLELLTLLWGILIGLLALLFLVMSRKKAKLQVSGCLACLVLSCTPGLSVTRSNLVFIPTMFFSLVLSISVFEMLTVLSDTNPFERVSRTNTFYRAPSLILIMMICTLAVCGSLYRSIIQRLDVHPLSINQILQDYDFIFGYSAQFKPTIPIERRNYLIKKLSNFGIEADNKEPDLIFCDMYNKARIMTWWSIFSADNWKSVFIPIAAFLTP